MNKSRLHLIFFLSLFFVFSLLLAACSSAQEPETYTIGVVADADVLIPTYEGFKAEMTRLGYVEGKNVTYLFDGVTGVERSAIETGVKALLDKKEKLDLIFVLGTMPAIVVKEMTAGTNIPVVFDPVIHSATNELVESISHPGGNVTGVQDVDASSKALEWLLKIMPGTKQVYVFHSPDDFIATGILETLPDAAVQLGVELVVNMVDPPEKALEIIETMPEDAAILILPVFFDVEPIEMLAIERGIPAGAYNNVVNNLVFSYETDEAAAGAQGARIVDKVLKGAKPADLPVETSEFFFRVNLKTANAIGLNIPDEILNQAHTVIR